MALYLNLFSFKKQKKLSETAYHNVDKYISRYRSLCICIKDKDCADS